MRKRRDVGETLVEILLTVVITGITITALVSSLGVAGNAGNAHRSSVQTDVEIRNYAEATKAAAQLCVDAVGATYDVIYEPPIGFTAVTDPTDNDCPGVAATKLLTLTVTGPMGLHQTMDIKVRTP
jgi:type II secretory pathway pseudopilin PulG